MAAPSFRRRRFPALGLFAGFFAFAASSAVGGAGLQPPERRVLEFTISDLDEDHLDFLTGWDRRGGDLLEGFARGTARFRAGPGIAPGFAPEFAPGFAPILPGLAASDWLWLEGAAAPDVRPVSAAVRQVAGTRRLSGRRGRESARPARERTPPRVGPGALARPAAPGAGPRRPRFLPVPSVTAAGTGRWAPPPKSASGRGRPRPAGARPSASGKRTRARGAGVPRPAGVSPARRRR